MTRLSPIAATVRVLLLEPRHFTYAGISASGGVTVRTGMAINTVAVLDVVRPLTLVGNSSLTTVRVGKSGSLAGIQSTTRRAHPCNDGGDSGSERRPAVERSQRLSGLGDRPAKRLGTTDLDDDPHGLGLRTHRASVVT